MRETRDVCEYIAALTPETVPEELFELAKLYALDALGAAIYGSKCPGGPGLSPRVDGG